MTDPTMPKDPSDNVLEAIDRYTTSLGIYCAARDALIAEQSKPQQIEYEQFDLERALAGESVFNIDGEERKITRHGFNNELFVMHFPHGKSSICREYELHGNYHMQRKKTMKYYALVLWDNWRYKTSMVYNSIEELRSSVTGAKEKIIAEHSIEVPV